MKRSHAILALLVVGVLLMAGVAAYAAPPVQNTTAQTAAPIAQEAAPAYLTLNLKAGFPLDPFIVSVNGGGPVEASTFDPSCTGWVNQDATLAVEWSGTSELVRIFYFSDHNPTLMVQLPDGKYVCNDNANRLLLDPSINLDNPDAGEYRVWVGAADKGQLIPGVLVITTHDNVTVGNFALGALIKRGAMADNLDEPVATDERKAAAEKLLGGVMALKAARSIGDLETIGQDVTVTGTTEAHELPIGEAFCNGYLNEKPDMVFNAPEGVKSLLVYFEGNSDSTLVVAQPDGTFLCNDDSLRGVNENPLVLIKTPQAGQYEVWVGRVSADADLTGKLTVTKLAKQPAKLAPKPAPTPAQ
jgi:hypothetical protein